MNTKHKALWDITHGQRLRYSSAILAIGVATAFSFAMPLISKYAIDLVTDDASADNALLVLAGFFGLSPTVTGYLVMAAMLIVLMTAIAGVFNYYHGRWAAMASEGIVRKLRDRMYTHLEHVRLKFHDTADTGDLVQRCSSDVETLRVFLAQEVVEIGRTLMLVLIVTPVLFWLNTSMAWASLALMPLIIIVSIFFFLKVRRVFLEADEAEAEMTATLQENLTGIRVVRAFARQNFEIDKFAEKNAKFRDLHKRLFNLMAIFWAGNDLMCLSQIAIVLFYGAYSVMTGDITIGTLFAFLTYISMVIWPIQHLGRVLTDAGKATVSLGRLEEILNEADEPAPDNAAANTPDNLQGNICFEHVNFAFQEGRTVINDLSFEIKAGQTLAIVGQPGSGKSTIIQLLMRLYDYQQGSIRLDGIELNTLDRKFVREQIGVVLQEPFMYARSITENLKLGNHHASEAEALEMTRAAHIHESILRFNDGYDTLVGERGVTLSGGQRQRLALARALLKHPPILVLDDSLSAVDVDTESKIIESLHERRGRQTTIIIAHRLSSVLHADKILVVGDGKLIQSGTHQSLKSVPGPYRNLWEIQSEAA